MSIGRLRPPTSLRQTVAVLLVGCFLFAAPRLEAQQAVTKERVLFVPFEELSVLLNDKQERIFLSRSQWKELRRAAARRAAEMAPENAWLRNADYRVTIDNSLARIEAKIGITVLKTGWQEIPLAFSETRLHQARLDGRSAPLIRRADGTVALLLQGQGDHELVMELQSDVTSMAAFQSLRFRLPDASTTTLTLDAPGNIDVKGGATVVERIYDTGRRRTRFRLLPQRGRVDLLMTANNVRLQQKPLVVSRSVIVSTLSATHEQLDASLSLDVLHSSIDRFTFRLPKDFQVVNVHSAHLAQWSVHEDGNVQRIDLTLSESISGMERVAIRATRQRTEPRYWTASRIVVDGVAAHSCIIGLMADARLKPKRFVPEKLIPLDSGMLPITPAEPSNARAANGRMLAVFYAPTADYELRAELEHVPTELNVTMHVKLDLREQEQRLRAGVVLSPIGEKLRRFVFQLPKGWVVSQVGDGAGHLLEWKQLQDDGKTARFAVRLASDITAGATDVVVISASRLPEDWLGEWQERTVRFPKLAIEKGKRKRGALAVSAADDWTLRPDMLEGLRPLDAGRRSQYGLPRDDRALAYEFGSEEVDATFRVRKRTPRVAARSYAFFDVRDGVFEAHYELMLDVSRAKSRFFRLALPASTPRTASIRGGEGIVVEEATPRLDGDQRTWTIRLASARRGRIPLLIRFEQPLQIDDRATMDLPRLDVVGAIYQSHLVAVEAEPVFAVEVETSMRHVDVGELAEATRLPGKHLVGTFASTPQASQIKLTVVRQPLRRLPEVIVERAELVTRLSSIGRTVSAARYRVRSKVPIVSIKLPKHTDLWSATVDGQPVRPHRRGSHVLFSLESTGRKPHTIRVVYESPLKFLGRVTTVDFTAPELWMASSESDNARPVPQIDLEWHLSLPSGYRVVRSGGNVSAEHIPRPGFAWDTAWRALKKLGGGGGGVLSVVRQKASSIESTDAAAMAESDFKVREGGALPGGGGLAGVPMGGEIGGGGMPGAGAGMPKLDEHAKSAPPGPGGFGAPRSEPTPRADADRQTDEAQAQAPAQNAAPVAGKRYWALQGLRSVKIEVRAADHSVSFRSLGQSPRLRATIIDGTRTGWTASLVGLVILIAGVLLSRTSPRKRLGAVGAVWIVALVLSSFGGPLTPYRDVFAVAAVAATLLIPVWVVMATIRIVSAIFVGSGRRFETAAARAVIIALIVSGMGRATSTALSQQPPSKTMRQRARVPAKARLPIPPDAIVVPYDPAKWNALEQADRVLVPYARYVELWNMAHPDEPLGPARPSARYAIAGARYSMTLDDQSTLLLDGQLEFDVLDNEPIDLPLALEGAVLRAALLDGKPAAVHIARAGGKQQATRASLPLVGRGRHVLKLKLELPVARQGGWRQVAARIPNAPATSIRVVAQDAGTELRRLSSDTGWRWESTSENQEIAWGVEPDGRFTIAWRARIESGVVDDSLTCRSESLVDITAAGIRSTSHIELSFGRTERGEFRFRIPSGYQVERVTGKNIRGWRLQDATDAKTLVVELLAAVQEKEAFDIVLARHDVFAASEARSGRVPSLELEGAALHRGTIWMRTSPLLEVRVTRTESVVRTDAPLPKQLAAPNASAALPLGARPFRAFQFHRTPFRIEFQASLPAANREASWRILVREGETAAAVEAELRLSCQGRPLHQINMLVPNDLRLERVEAEQLLDWTVVDRDDQRHLALFFATGHVGELVIAIEGSLSDHERHAAVDLPRFDVLGVERERGQVVVQADQTLDIEPRRLEGLRPILLSEVHAWLTASQRNAARMAWRFDSAPYSGALQLKPRKAHVTCDTMTNVRMTFHAIEETILLDYEIRRAGVRRLAVRLPASWKGAAVLAPRLRQHRFETVAEAPNVVRLVLQLEDPISGPYRVLLMRDRQLSSEPQSVPLPEPEETETVYRYVTFENAGRDELVVDRHEGFRPVQRDATAWKRLRERLPGANMTMAFVTPRSSKHVEVQYRSKRRKIVETVDASIGMAQTTLVVDAAGTYRGAMLLKVDNRTEPALEVELPSGASLLTAIVAGEPVKPAAGIRKNTPSVLRIPLIKTAPGDLDYAVELKYGGTLDLPAGTRDVEFPLIRTLNIPVSLSNVTLYLPPEFHWLRFGGTAERLPSEGAFLSGYTSYRRQQVEHLKQVARGKDVFSAARALYNLRRLMTSETDRYERSMWKETGNVAMAEARTKALARQAVREAGRPQASHDDEWLGDIGNRKQLEELVEQQKARQVENEVTRLKGNFKVPQSKGQVAEKKNKDKNIEREVAEQNAAKNVFAQPKQEAKPGEITVGGRLSNRPEPQTAVVQGRAGTKTELRRAYQQRLTQQQQQAQVMQREVPAELPDAPRLSPDVATEGGRATGFASLDVKIPARGEVFYFTIPRGDVQITARAIPVSWSRRGGSLLAALAVALLIWLAGRARPEEDFAAGQLRKIQRGVTAAPLLLLGIFMILFYLPLFGIVACLAAFVVAVR